MQAATIGVAVDTSGLAAGTYHLDLQLIDGDGAVNNTATFSSFSWAGLTPGALSLTGTATGSAATSIVLTDADPSPDPFTSALQDFTTAGGASGLAFVLSYSENFAGGFPDGLSVGILDVNFATLATLVIDLDAPPVLTSTSGNGVTVTASSVPEPGLAWLTAAGGLGLAWRGRRRQLMRRPDTGAPARQEQNSQAA